MNALDLLRGTLALLASRRGVFVHAPLWLGLLPALFFGALLAMADEGGPGFVRDAVVPVWVCACAVAPLLMGLPWTTAMQVGAPARRDELFVLPLGRLALPAAVVLGAAALVALWTAVTTLGLVMTLGTDAFVGVLGAASTASCALGALALFAAASCVSSIGGSWAQSAFMVPLLALVLVASMDGMGYADADVRSYLDLCALALSGWLLALPFLLHARPPHAWSASREPAREAPAALGLLTGGLALVTLVVGGAGSAALVALVGAGLVALARRRWPIPRRHAPTVAVVGLSALLPGAPLLGVRLVVDARGDASRGAWDELKATHVELSPDGRRVALLVSPAAGVSPRPARQQLVVVDLLGERAPIVVPAPYVGLDVDQARLWSSDGRWVAVHDLTVGRLRCDLPRAGAAVHDPFELVARRLVGALDETWLVDATTGEVTLREGLALAPGWTSPGELVSLGLTWSQGRVLRDGAGRERVVPASAGGVDVVAYERGRPVLRVGGGAPRRFVATRAGHLPGGELWRWQEDGELVAHDPAQGEAWTYEVDLGERDAPIVARRRGQRLELPPATHLLLPACDERSVVAVTPGEGLVRITADDGARTTLDPAVTAAVWVDPTGQRAVVKRGEADLALVDLGSGETRSLRPPGAWVHGLASSGERLEADGKQAWPWLVGPEGQTRSLQALLAAAPR